MMTVRSTSTALFAFSLLLAPAAARGQDARNWDTNLFANRQQLTQLLARYDSATGSRGYSREFRALANQDAELIRRRLVEGDFQVGDQISLAVTGQPSLTGNFSVAQGRVLQLPDIGEISLAGLLRSELPAHLQQQIGRFVRNPEIFVRTTLRITVLGAVGAHGFHDMDADARITDVLVKAGNITPNAKITDIKIERGGNEIWSGEPLQTAITEGRTLDQLSLRAGDRVVVPAQTGSRINAMTVLRALPALVSLGFLIGRII